jgi:hypothetical protein
MEFDETHLNELGSDRNGFPAPVLAGSGSGIDPVAGTPRGFRLPAPWLAVVERRRWLAVVIATFVVAIMLLSSALPPPSAFTGSRFHTDSSPVAGPNDSTLNLALANTSLFPNPTVLPASGGNVTLPKLVALTWSSEQAEGLLYVQVDTAGHHLLQFQSGLYDPNLAQSILLGTGCPQACPPTVPIHWNAPATIYDFGLAPVQSDSAVALGTEVVVAASSNNATWLWVGGDTYGSGQWEALNNTWHPLPVPGGDGRVAAYGCTILLTTGAPATVTATTYQLACQSTPKPNDGGHQGPLSPSPTVTEVAPNCGPSSQSVTIYGTNFQNGATAQFGGGTVPTTFFSSTKLTATTPSGSGTVDVIVHESAGSSSPNPPSDQYTYSTGSAQPCVWGVTAAQGVPGTVVTVTGYGFVSYSHAFFGGVPAGTTYVNPSTLSAVVPGTCGVVDVTVVNSGPPSPTWVGDRFTATSVWPSVTSVTPYKGGSGTQVTVGGAGFTCGTATVKFGSTTATGVTVTSYAALKANAPTGVSGTVDVTVTENSHTSNTSAADQFSYTPGAVPTVTAINVSSGSQGTPVTVTGTGFTRYATANFGSVAATGVSYVSSTSLTCVAPLTYGIVNVTVTVNHLTSGSTPADLFTYPLVAIGQVYPDYGIAGNTVLISGANIAPDAQILFGATQATSKTWLSPQSVDAVVPTGTGTVDVKIVENGTVSAVVPLDRFSYQTFAPFVGRFVNFTTTTVHLGTAADAAPLVWANPIFVPGQPILEGVLLSNTTSGYVVFDWSNTSGTRFVPHSLEGISGGPTGSPLDSVGSTLVAVSGGHPGQVAVVLQGSRLFALFTGRVDARVMVQTAISVNGGLTWNVTYTAPATMGAVLDPQVVNSPDGPFFATWRDNGAGPWEVDLAVFSDSGHLIQNSSVIRGSGGAGLTNASSPTVVVDDWERPLVAWQSTGSPGTLSSVRYSGGFVTPSAVAAWIFTGFKNLTKSDFYPIGNLTQWRATQNGSLSTLLSDLQTQQWCPAETILFNRVYAMLSQSFVYPFFNATPALCGSAPPIHYFPTEVLPTIGPGSPGSVFSIEEEWLVEALGYGVTSPPAWLGSPGGPAITTNLAGLSSLHVDRGGHTLDRSKDFLSVAPVTLNPNSVLMNTTGVFNTTSTTTTGSCTGGGSGVASSTVTDAPANYTTYVVEVFNNSQFGKGSPPTGYYLNLSQAPTSVYMNNLTGQAWGNWTESVAARYQAILIYENGCVGNQTIRPVAIPRGSPTFVNLTVSGTWSTQLGFLPSAPPLLVSKPNPSNPSQMITNTRWNNSMWATANITTNLTTGGQKTTVDHQSARGYRIAENVTMGNVTLSPGSTYSTTFQVRSTNGGTDFQNWTPRLNAYQSGYGFTNISATSTCSYNMSTDPVLLYWDRNNITNITNTSVDLTWYASGSGVGMVVYQETYGAAEEQTAYDQSGVNYHGYSDRYTVELHDLVPWGIYTVQILQTKQDGGCHVFQNGATWRFNTTRTFQLSEQDAPFDSITRTGGGATFTWNVPLALLNTPGVAYQSGWLRITNASNASEIITVPLNGSIYEPVAGTFETNVTTLSMNSRYYASMQLNYTYGRGTVSGNSSRVAFTYLRDTSGDGLTDWEKLHGWKVTTQSSTGAYSTRNVYAAPSEWATNGLVNDLVEKEFGLDPGTVDSAGSHMLDTWNLTFDLGAYNNSPMPPSGSNFRLWYENASYDPFQIAQYPGGPQLHGPVARNSSGLSDASPYNAEVMWSLSELNVFDGLTGVRNASWIRGVLGHDGAERTLTVWGKLSWGANPLAQSTPMNGVADGARIDPLGSVDLQLSSLSAALGSSVCSAYAPGSGGSNGWAVEMLLNDSSVTGTNELTNYTTPTNITSSTSCGTVTGYTVTVPVDNTVQFQHLDVRLIINISGTLTAVPVTGSATTGSASLDMFGTGGLSYFSATDGDSTDYYWNPVVAGGKVPTWLFVPTGNGTLSSLPWGLKRYVGEQAFDLLVVDNNNSGQGPISSDVIPLPWGGTTTLSLAYGLNNILVPRTQLLNSSFGRGILLGSNMPRPPAGVTPAMMQYDTHGWTLLGGSQQYQNLSCYWQDRAVKTGATGVLCSGEQGTAKGTANSIHTLVDTSGCTSGNCGGVPSNPYAESSGNAGPALQAVFTLNVSNSTDLDLLIGGLMDNMTGGVNGTLQSITSQAGSLGLARAVLTALANTSVTSNGLYGAPTSVVPPPPPPSSGLWGAVWNAFSGFASWVVSGVTKLAGLIWSAVTAAWDFVARVVTGLANLYVVAILFTVSALKTAGTVLMNAMKAALAFLITQVQNAIKAALAGWQAMQSQLQTSWNRSITQAARNYHNLGNITSATAGALWAEAGGAIYLIGFTVALAATIAITILSLISFGAAAVAGIIVGIILSVIVAIVLAFTSDIIGPWMITTLQGAVGTVRKVDPNWCPTSSSDWSAAAGLFGWFDTGFTNTYAAGQLYKAYSDKSVKLSDFTLQDIAFAIGLEGAVLSGIQLASGCNVALAISAMGLAFASVVFDAFSYAKDRANDVSGDRTMDAVIAVMDSIVLGTNIGQLAT